MTYEVYESMGGSLKHGHPREGIYRKKPVVIEARHIETYHDLEPIAAWVRSEGGKAVAGQDDTGPAYMLINTLEGTHRADIRDFVIRGVAGEFYPCKPDIFAATYELVEATDE